MKEYSHPRRRTLNVDITEKQYNKLQLLLPFGIKAKIFGVIIDDLIELIEGENGHMLLGALMQRYIKYKKEGFNANLPGHEQKHNADESDGTVEPDQTPTPSA